MKKLLALFLSAALCIGVGFAQAQSIEYRFNPFTQDFDAIGILNQTGTFQTNPIEVREDGSTLGLAGTLDFQDNITISLTGSLGEIDVPDIWVDEAGDTMTGTLTTVDVVVQSGSDITLNDEVAGGTQCAQLVNGVISGTGADCTPLGATDIWVNETGDTMTGGLNFSGVANDITSSTNENITLNPAGTGIVEVADEAFAVGESTVGVSVIANFASDVKAVLLTRPGDVETDIATPVNGMIAYDGLEDLLKAYINGAWVELGAPADPISVYNDTGGTLYACSAVYISGEDVGSGLPEVSVADNDGAGTIPAVGLLQSDIANGSSGTLIVSGLLTLVDTAVTESWVSGDALYVNDSGSAASSDCAETLTSSVPSGAGDTVQKIGTVVAVNGTTGSIFVSGADRVGSGGVPGGSNTQVQFNNNSSFGGADGATWTISGRTLGVSQTLDVSGTMVVPDGASVTTDAAGEVAFDTDAFGASRGAIQYYDGTSANFVPGALNSTTFSTGEVLYWESTDTVGPVTTLTNSGGDLTLNAGDLIVTSGSIDISAGRMEIPSYATCPSSCADGEICYDTDATSGSRWYICESGTWTQQGGSGSGEWTDNGTTLQPNETSDAILLGGATLYDDEILNLDGTMVINGTAEMYADHGVFSVTGMVTGTVGVDGIAIEGDTVDGNKMRIYVEDPTQQRTATFPDETGRVLMGIKKTADPCSGLTEGDVFYNDTSNYYCYCDGTNDVQIHSPATACF